MSYESVELKTCSNNGSAKTRIIGRILAVQQLSDAEMDFVAGGQTDSGCGNRLDDCDVTRG